MPSLRFKDHSIAQLLMHVAEQGWEFSMFRDAARYGKPLFVQIRTHRPDAYGWVHTIEDFEVASHGADEAVRRTIVRCLEHFEHNFPPQLKEEHSS